MRSKPNQPPAGELVSIGPMASGESGGCSVQARLKRWTRELLALGGEVTLTVSELRCPDPECPDLETVIGISVEPGHWRRLRFRKPASEVTRAELEALIR